LEELPDFNIETNNSLLAPVLLLAARGSSRRLGCTMMLDVITKAVFLQGTWLACCNAANEWRLEFWAQKKPKAT